MRDPIEKIALNIRNMRKQDFRSLAKNIGQMNPERAALLLELAVYRFRNGWKKWENVNDLMATLYINWQADSLE